MKFQATQVVYVKPVGNSVGTAKATNSAVIEADTIEEALGKAIEKFMEH